MTIRILLADDESLLRMAFTMVLGIQPDMSVVGEAADGAQAERLARQLHPDVVLMDIRMPGTDGIAATRDITADAGSGSVKVIVLTMLELDEYVRAALQAGASGFLLKDSHPDQLLDAIRRVHQGESLFAPKVLTRLIAAYMPPDVPLPDVEIELIEQWILAGATCD